MEEFFIDELGNEILPISYSEFNKLLINLQNEFFVSEEQIIASASFSLAMIIRAALAYNAADAFSIALIQDNLDSKIILATIKHLVNAGANASILFLNTAPFQTLSSSIALQLKALKRMGINITEIEQETDMPDLDVYTKDAHNILCGLSTLTTPPSKISCNIISKLNEMQIPVHCLQIPFGIEPDDGTIQNVALYASSTLSLGLPLNATLLKNDYCGRNYICDISFTKEQYQIINPNLGRIFSCQPVIRLLLPEYNRSCP